MVFFKVQNVKQHLCYSAKPSSLVLLKTLAGSEELKLLSEGPDFTETLEKITECTDRIGYELSACVF